MHSKADTKLLCDQLFSSKTFPILDNMAMSAAIESNSFAIYIGTTARALKQEDLRFLTERGAQDQSEAAALVLLYTQAKQAVLCLSTQTPARASP
jgi:hypothetical protein